VEKRNGKIVFLVNHPNTEALGPIPFNARLLTYILSKHRRKVTIINAAGNLPSVSRDQMRAIKTSHILLVSPLTLDLQETMRFLARVKKANNEIITISGGAETTGNWRAILRRGEYVNKCYTPLVDYAVIGEGEQTLPLLVSHLEAGNLRPDLPGIAYSIIEDNQLQSVFRTIPAPCLCGEKFLNNQFVLLEEASIADYNGAYYVTESHRGCPFNCKFCYSPTVRKEMGFKTPGQAWRKAPPKLVADLWVKLYEKGLRRIYEAADDFLSGPAWTRRVIDEIKKRPQSQYFRAEMHIKVFGNVTVLARHQDELIESLKDVGVKEIFVGFESVCDEELENLGKAQTAADVWKAADSLKRTNMVNPALGLIMFTPWTKIQYILDKLRFLHHLGVLGVSHQLLLHTVLIRPNSPMYTELAKLDLLCKSRFNSELSIYRSLYARRVDLGTAESERSNVDSDIHRIFLFFRCFKCSKASVLMESLKRAFLGWEADETKRLVAAQLNDMNYQFLKNGVEWVAEIGCGKPFAQFRRECKRLVDDYNRSYIASICDTALDSEKSHDNTLITN
jgi:radical SAM superfamily enzyme YgiQ (UPF0313 family)